MVCAMAEAVLTVQLEKTNDVQLIRVSGPLDSVTHDQFRNQLDPLVNARAMTFPPMAA